MKPYYQDEWVTQYCCDALTMLRELESDSIDLLCTDPPYGIGFMGKDWDKALPDKNIWKECLRVLKPGSFGFVMSIPRADCLSRMIIAVDDAGFAVNFTPIYWAYASGFPKAQNIGKAVDKRLGVEREVIAIDKSKIRRDNPNNNTYADHCGQRGELTKPSTPQAKGLDGSYGGFQPKPAVEVIIVCMKPLSEKTFVDQALKNGKGITWLDDCRIPYESEGERLKGYPRNNAELNEWKGGKSFTHKYQEFTEGNSSGRFPANLLVSDDVLNDGRDRLSKYAASKASLGKSHFGSSIPFDRSPACNQFVGDSGSFFRYFDLDKWAQKTFPFLIVPKASKSEKNRGCEDLPDKQMPFLQDDGRKEPHPVSDPRMNRPQQHLPTKNSHPCVKPLKLMSYLITLGSRPGDTVVDLFGGSGTTAKACKLLGRKCITSEIEEKYCEIAAKRCSQSVMRLGV